MSAARKVGYDLISAPVADPSSAAIGIAQGLEPAAVLQAARLDGFHHVCQTEGHHFELELECARAMESNLAAYFADPLYFALGPQAKIEFDYQFNTSTVKGDLLTALSAFLHDHKANSSLQTSVVNCADEIFTNSIYNAPFVNLYTQFNPGVSRAQNSVFLDGKHFVRMQAAAYDDRVAIACRDPFGSLDVEAFLKRIQHTAEVGASRVLNFGAGGAGLGSYIIFNECSSLHIVAERGVATAVVCVFPLRMGGKKRELLPKHLHWFMK